MKKYAWISIAAVCLFCVLTGCLPEKTPVDIAGTVDIEVAHNVALTVEAQNTATSLPPIEENNAETPSVPETSVTPSPELAGETAVSPTAVRPNTRRELFAVLGGFMTAVNDQITMIEQLLFTPMMDDPAWHDALKAASSTIQTSYENLLLQEIPRQGTQAYGRTVDAIKFCQETATAVSAAAASADTGQLSTLEEELGNCTNELLSLTVAFEQGSNQDNLTPVPTFEARGCSGTSTGLIPLVELGTDTYQGFEGGLYPGGVNSRPLEHEAAGLALAEQIVPINGRIVILSIGMSNTRQESDRLIELMAQDETINPQVLFVNGAISGRSAQTIDSETADYWDLVDKKLARANATAEQVQVIWLKQAHAFPGRPFPLDAQTFQTELHNIVRIIGQKYPNVKMIYLSSRIYAGYASANLHPEPFAYQSGFSVKWLIEDYIDGQIPDSPWLAWGPYMWADGTTPRSDGLTWLCDDMIGDGTHPGDPGREKVANLLLEFFKSDTTTRGWFLSQP